MGTDINDRLNHAQQLSLRKEALLLYLLREGSFFRDHEQRQHAAHELLGENIAGQLIAYEEELRPQLPNLRQAWFREKVRAHLESNNLAHILKAAMTNDVSPLRSRSGSLTTQEVDQFIAQIKSDPNSFVERLNNLHRLNEQQSTQEIIADPRQQFAIFQRLQQDRSELIRFHGQLNAVAKILLIDTRFNEVADQAMAGKEVGGIDMNPDLVELETTGRGMDIEIQFDPAQLETMPITGFSPIIYSIMPVTNLPFLLGLTQDEGDQTQLGYHRNDYAREPERIGLLN
jgi:hypothetical protein